MLEEKPPEELANSLKISFNEVLAGLKALSTDSRLKVLIMLLQGPKTFQELMDQIAIKRTALANHLSELMKVFFITSWRIIFVYKLDVIFKWPACPRR